MANRWLRHLAQFRQNNSDLKPTEVMKKARASYQQNGGTVIPYERQGTESNYAKVGGRRRTKRQSRKSRRTRRR
jgi:hypothetical protein